MRRALLWLMLLGSPAFAEDTKDPNAPNAPNAEGDYGGVQPGQKKSEAPKKAKKPAKKGTLSWIGFETKNGGSDVFFQSIAAFEVNQRVDGNAVIVTLSGLSKLGHNTWRPIDTRFFETPIARITAKKKGKAVEVRVAFKAGSKAAQASVRSSTEADGMYYAYLTFAGGGSTASTKDPEK
ncbi:MAG TPA: hypothetical protein VIV11_37505 [Kofleriaceae bacterium]